MEKKLKNLLKTFKMNENTVSTIMGGVVVVIVAILMFNYFKSLNQDSDGLITEPSQTVQVTEGEKPEYLPDTYKVQKGDHLWGIAEKFYKSGYNFVDIAKENNIVDVNNIEVGQELKIPQVAVKKITLEESAVDLAVINTDNYTTVAGDYLWDIAVRAYNDGYAWTRIYEANKEVIGSNPSVLYKGIVLTIPKK